MLKVHKSVWLVFLFFALFLFSLNWLFPPQSDDFEFTTYGGFRGAFEAYVGWNGRFGEILRVGALGALAFTPIFAFLNTLVGILFILSGFILFYARWPKNLDDSVVISLFIFALMAFSQFGSTFIWPAGALNYLWGYTLIFLALIPYRLFYDEYCQNKCRGNNTTQNTSRISLSLLSICFFIMSFFAGMCSEILGLCVLICHAILLCYACIFARISLPSWYFMGVLGFFFGYLALYFSPGHAKRMAIFIDNASTFYSIENILSMSVYEIAIRLDFVYYKLMRNFTFIVFGCALLFFVIECFRNKAMKSCIAILIFLFSSWAYCYFTFSNFSHIVQIFFMIVCCFVLFLFYWQRGNAVLKKLYMRLFCIFCLFLFAMSITLQVDIPKRAMLLHFLLLFVALSYLYEASCEVFKDYIKKIRFSICLLCILYGLFVLSAYINVYIKWENMLQMVEMQKNEGKEEIVLPNDAFKSYYAKYGDWIGPGDDPSVWPNTAYAWFFNVKSFRIER